MPTGVYQRTEFHKRTFYKMGHLSDKKDKTYEELYGDRAVEIKNRMQLSHIGQFSHMKGKHHKPETIEKIRQARARQTNIKIPHFKGEQHYNWKGGFKPYPLGWDKTFKEQIRNRDGYRCVVCGMPETENCRRLCVHHVDYNKNNLELGNLVSLCHKCHGKTSYNREYWRGYFKCRNIAMQVWT